MKIKVYRKGPVFWNTFFYLVLSLVLLHLIKCLETQTSSLNHHNLIANLIDEKYLLCFALIAIFSLFQYLPLSPIFLSCFSIALISSVIPNLLVHLDKFIFLMVFVYALVSYYMIYFWSQEIKRPIFNSLIYKNDLRLNDHFIFKGKIFFDENVQGEDFILTNWDKDSCFILLKDVKKVSNKAVKIHIDFEGRNFIQLGEIVSVSNYSIGFGLIFQFTQSKDPISAKKEREKDFTWEEFYSILASRGLVPNQMYH